MNRAVLEHDRVTARHRNVIRAGVRALCSPAKEQRVVKSLGVRGGQVQRARAAAGSSDQAVPRMPEAAPRLFHSRKLIRSPTTLSVMPIARHVVASKSFTISAYGASPRTASVEGR